MNEIEKIDNVISQLKYLKRDIQKKNKLSDSLFNANGVTRKRRQAMDASLNWQCMHLDKQRKAAWKAIKDAEFLEVSLEPQEYNPSGFHCYKG